MSEHPNPFTVDELEAALFATLTPNRQKLAMVAVTAKLPTSVWDNEAMLDEAFAQLAKRPNVETFGDITNWRFSEICLKSAE